MHVSLQFNISANKLYSTHGQNCSSISTA